MTIQTEFSYSETKEMKNMTATKKKDYKSTNYENIKKDKHWGIMGRCTLHELK